MNPMGALDDICALLASGKNVISTAVTALIAPASMGQKVVDRLEKACAEGSTSFHATGIEPGWASEVLPLTMSGLFRSIDSLLVQELLDYSHYESSDMLFDIMGFGRAPDADVPGANAALLGGPFRAPLMLVADGLGAAIDDAAKGLLNALTRALARELGPSGVRVNIVAPGLIRTPTAEFVIRGEREAREAAILPLKRIGEPDDIAKAIAFLLSDDASYVTGSTLVVDGGRLLVGGETVDLFGKCDPSELTEHFDDLRRAAHGT
jgi:NAD(P)-dependent dehydrogenase (short-subunit alcohol dehydrogenase family)